VGLLQMFAVTSVFFCMYNYICMHTAEVARRVMLLNPDRSWTCPESRAQHDINGDAQ
jgi:hypothetical protein